MGNSTSNVAISNLVTVEDARQRLTAEEHDHLKCSYDKIMCPPTEDNFIRRAMVGLPVKFSEQLFKVFAGVTNTNLPFDQMLCGLVILIRGSRQEKLQLLYYIMSSDGQKLTRGDVENSLASWGVESPQNLDILFTVSESCSFQHFNKWLAKFKPIMGVYDWILDGDKFAGGFICSGTRTFLTYHQFLSEQASFTEKQVMSLEKHYSMLRKHFSRSKKFDLDALYNCLHPLYSYEFTQHFFLAFDLNNDGNIDSRELTIGLSMILEGEDSFAKFVFSMFDMDEDMVLNAGELATFLRLIGSFCMVTEPLRMVDTPGDNVRLEDFVFWCNNNCSMYKFHSHLKNIVYIVFGVKPDLTFNIIRQWMEMEADMKLIAGKAYYIANNEWFKGTGGHVNNAPILEAEYATNSTKNIPVITAEGGTLRKGLIHGVDYQVTSQVLWFTLDDWYACDTPICRRARLTPGGDVTIELFPIKLNFYRQPLTNSRSAIEALASGFQAINIKASFEGSLSTLDPPRHVLSYIGVFYSDDTLRALINILSMKLKLGREDLRLWKMTPQHKLVLLDEGEDKTLDVLNIQPSNNILIEVRNFDMSWPEEVANIIHQNRMVDRRAPTARVNGTTGLNNLGNTCFMNSSIQCLSNTRALSVYFLKELHLRELNQDNPDSLNGLLALRYANLIKNLWSGTSRTIAPLKMRWTIAKFASQFNGFGQHDAQELLAFLLDGLHEDLNRITTKPYTQINDSGSRPDAEVAEEFWNNHAARNRSIIVDLFHGQLKSALKCLTCGFTSVRFDPFSSLSLPLPENENVIIEVFVVRLDPELRTTQYCLWLNNEYTMTIVQRKLKEKIPDIVHFLFVDIENSTIKRIVGIDEPLRSINFTLYAFELPGSGPRPEDYVVIYSRHYVTVEEYFFEWQHRQVQLFGTPFVVAVSSNNGESQAVKIKDRIRAHLVGMYQFDSDFAEDLMFNIKKVKQNGRDCTNCDWKELCYGCKLMDAPELGNCGYLTVDWSSAVVHLIRQYDDDTPIIEDNSVADAKKRQSQPIDLSTCLYNFTKEEELGGEWYCEKCACHRNATKKLDIWRMPPILIIHLKRFSLQGGKWVKCQRSVMFPDSFDPTPFLVQSSRSSLSQRLRTESVNYLNTVLVEREKGGDDYDEVSIKSMDDDEVVNSNNRNPLEQHKNSLSYITSSMAGLGKKKINDDRPFYDLYAVTAHTGHIGHGHYVGFAVNPNRHWYYYNDSQVKKTTKKRVLSEPAYMLFYERRNLKLEDLLPCYNNPLDQSFDFDASIIMKDALHAADRRSCKLQ